MMTLIKLYNFQTFFKGVPLGPAENLTQEPICASRNLEQNEAEEFFKISNVSVTGLVEVCACIGNLVCYSQCGKTRKSLSLRKYFVKSTY